MAYNPYTYNPYTQQIAAPYVRYAPQASMAYQQPYDMRIGVKGMAGAEAFQMPPNSHAILFDEDSDVLFYKSTDAAGYGTVVDFDLVRRSGKAQASAALPPAEYVNRSEFDTLAEKVESLSAAIEAQADTLAEKIARAIKEDCDGKQPARTETTG